MSNFVVLGAGGGTGLETVKRLLAVTSENVTAVVRDPSKYQSILPQDPRLKVVKGDVSDESSLKEVIKGSKGVVFAASGVGYWSAKDVDYLGVERLARAAKANDPPSHVVLVSSQLVSKHNWLHPVRILLNNIRWSLMDYKLQGEDALRTSGAPYTIVRPGGLSRGLGGVAKVVAGQGDRGVAGADAKSITRTDVAAVCVSALLKPALSQGVTMEIGSSTAQLSTPQYEENIANIFSGLSKGT